MPLQLAADFEKQFRDGPLIQARFEAFDDASRVVALFGPSGGGKTTILRCVAGLERPTRGTLRFLNDQWYDGAAGQSLPPQRRNVGYLPQDYALFPHLTVGENIGYPLRGAAAGARESRIAEMVNLLRLPGLEARFPNEISGGQQQRVALARAVVGRPNLLLLDEPLSALDSVIREELRGELRELLRTVAVPTLLISHDRAEVSALADRVLIVDRGAIRQEGSVDDVFLRPASLDVARVVGVENILEGTLTTCPAMGSGVFFRPRDVPITDGTSSGRKRTPDSLAHGDNRLSQSDDGVFFRIDGKAPQAPSGRVAACIRAENVAVGPPGTAMREEVNVLPGRISGLSPQGAFVRVSLDCGLPLVALVARAQCDAMELSPGKPVTASIDQTAVHVV